LGCRQNHRGEEWSCEKSENFAFWEKKRGVKIFSFITLESILIGQSENFQATPIDWLVGEFYKPPEATLDQKPNKQQIFLT